MKRRFGSDKIIIEEVKAPKDNLSPLYYGEKSLRMDQIR